MSVVDAVDSRCFAGFGDSLTRPQRFR